MRKPSLTIAPIVIPRRAHVILTIALGITAAHIWVRAHRYTSTTKIRTHAYPDPKIWDINTSTTVLIAIVRKQIAAVRTTRTALEISTLTYARRALAPIVTTCPVLVPADADTRTAIIVTGGADAISTYNIVDAWRPVLNSII